MDFAGWGGPWGEFHWNKNWSARSCRTSFSYSVSGCEPGYSKATRLGVCWRSWGSSTILFWNAYRIGVMMGFREQLEQQRSECSEQGLIWMGEPGLDEFFGRRHPRTQRLRGGRYRTSGAHKDGRRDGLSLRIRPVFDGSTPRRRGNLLSA